MLHFADYSTTRTTIDRFIKWVLTVSIGIFMEALRMVIFPPRNWVMRLYNTDTR
jgi:hypothetical protein